MSGISCVICSEFYKSTDEVYSTSCGHVYHYHCMQQWRGRATTCPQCRTHNPTYIKLYLDFEDASATEAKLSELKKQLAQSVSQASQLQQQLDDSKQQINALEGSTLHASELQQQLDQAERDFIALQNQYSESERKCESLQEECDNLKINNESQQDELTRMRNKEDNKLLESDDKLPLVLSELEQSVLNISTLQAQYDQSKRNLLALQKQLSDSEMRLKLESDAVFRLQEQNVRQQSDLAKAIKSQSDAMKMQPQTAALMQTIKMLQERIKIMSGELNEEISKSTDLEMQNLKYKSMLRSSSMHTLANTALNLNPAGMQSLSINDNYPMQNNNFANKKTKQHNKNNHITGRVISVNPIPNFIDKKPGGDDAKCVVIKGIPKTVAMEQKFELFVLQLTKKMDLKFVEADIESASLLERNFYVRHKIEPNKMSLLVRFKTVEQRNEFIANKEKLDQFDDTQPLIIYEYLTQHVNKLFQCAKDLHIWGYKNVFCKNHSVFVKKDAQSPMIKITNEKQLEELIEKEVVFNKTNA